MIKPYKIPESVLVIIHTADLEVLLIERADKPGFWQSVTGSKESISELLIETAIREVREETGIIIPASGKHTPAKPNSSGKPQLPFENLRDWHLSNVYEIYPVWRHRYAPGVTHNKEHVFGLRVPRDVALQLCPQEHVAHMWLPYREAAEKCFSASNAEAILLLPRYVE
jgi:dATP pyrophosphohydrolase